LLESLRGYQQYPTIIISIIVIIIIIIIIFSVPQPKNSSVHLFAADIEWGGHPAQESEKM